ncbi:MAG: nascent polypeptide-associated complex protein [Candidatus Bathyarchaeia archaeon]
MKLRRGMSPRDTKRLMKRMGLSMDAMPDVQQVVFRTSVKEITIEDPEVAILNVKGQKMFQVTGGKMTEKALKTEEREPAIPEEDVQLVADQTGKSMQEARQALEESGGDLAKAILLLQTK